LFRPLLSALQEKHPDIIGDIRTDRGAMMAVELVQDGDADKPNVDLTAKLVSECYDRGLVVLRCGIRGNVFRFLPALTISDARIDEGFDIFDAALQACL